MAQLYKSTPAADGFWMPGEFEPHDGCWLLFPHRPDVWRDNAKPAQQAFASVARAIADFESVTVGVNRDHYTTARDMLTDAVRVVELSSDDAWIRDCGPTFVINDSGQVRGVDWEFNAWGGELDGLYDSWEQDNLVARKVLEIERVGRYKAPIVLEGGAIHVDGQGTLITTSACLLNENRNPSVSKPEMEQHLRSYLGVDTIIWLDFDAFEETDGHVDGVCAFLHPGVLVVDWCDDPDEIDYAVCRSVYEQLSRQCDARGRPFELHKLPAANPPPMTAVEANGVIDADGTYPRNAGDIIGGTYVNFYMANGGLVMPTYDDPNDDPAHDILQKLCPDRKVVGVPAREIALAGGMIHCITQQQPAPRQGTAIPS